MTDPARETERQFILDGLHSSEARLLALVRDLAPAQWSFRESPERWSIAENVEHLILFEGFIRAAIANALAQPPEAGSQVAEKERLILGLATSRSVTRFTTREAATPTGRWLHPAGLLSELRRTRAQTIAFAADTHADLRSHFFAHIAFGDLDCRQWFILLAQHMERHALQIEQVKADAKWPRGDDPTHARPR